jgi:2-polyprenyl-3-methyl-5-hydroxy-6-metoxy-1,4-benzoquinol methylase
MSLFNYELTSGTPCLSSDINVRNRGEIINRILSRQGGFSSCLDAGCGYGAYINLLAGICSRVVGIDVNKSFLTEARSHSKDLANTSFVQMSLETIALSNKAFDFIICIETLEHVDNDKAVISEFHRLIKPKGKIILSVPYKWFPFETHGIRLGKKVVSSPFGLGFPLLTFLPNSLRRTFATARVYSRKDLINLFEENDFIVDQISFLMPGLDIFERKSKSSFLVKLLRNMMSLVHHIFENQWGSTIVVIGSPNSHN